MAALTIPVLIAQHQEKQTVVKLKKAYSIMSQAYLSAKNEYGEFANWGTTISENVKDESDNNVWAESSIETADLLWDKLVPFLNVVSRCNATDSSCERYTEMYTLNGSKRSVDISHLPIINLSDGTTFLGGWVHNSECKNTEICADFGVDINGKKGPNTLGKDIFYFYMTAQSIIPIGSAKDEYPIHSGNFHSYCVRSSNDSVSNGYGCTAWVLYNENLDYLHCDDLSWDGKTKCK